jgi:hypothetical protein
VSTEVLEGAMSDTATDARCGQNTAQISEEYLAQRELADSQGWSLDGTSAAHWPSQRPAFAARMAKCTSIAVASVTLSLCADALEVDPLGSTL